MNKGILIYAHNNTSVDYALMSIISGGLAKKNLNVPVSLVTDTSTVEWMTESNVLTKASEVFDQIIIVDRPITTNTRNLADGLNSVSIPFINSNRASAWDLTPYDRTLLIDSDFLIFSDTLNSYWDVDSSVLIGKSINDVLSQERLGYHDVYISDTGIKLLWATTVMFTKNDESKLFFDTVNIIKDNYEHFADIFMFNPRQYRNDISFSIASHILNGFETTNNVNLPPVLTLLDKDILEDVVHNNLILLISQPPSNNFCAASITSTDIHIMNKQSIIRNSKKLLEMI